MTPKTTFRPPLAPYSDGSGCPTVAYYDGYMFACDYLNGASLNAVGVQSYDSPNGWRLAAEQVRFDYTAAVHAIVSDEWLGANALLYPHEPSKTYLLVEYGAQVDIHHKRPTAGTLDHWKPLSQWNLAGDYRAYESMAAVGESGWPEGFRPMTVAYVDLQFNEIADHQLTLRGEQLAALKGELPWFRALQSHVTALVAQGLTVRVVVWGL